VRTAIRITVATTAVLLGAALLARRTGEPRRHGTDGPEARPIRVLPPDSAIEGRVEAEHFVGRYSVSVIADTVMRERVVDVRLDGRRVYAVRAMTAWLEMIGRDITGDGVPDLVILLYTGGLHCCTHAVVLSLGDTLGDFGTINGADGDIEFSDVTGDGLPEARIGDWRFAYWRGYSFVETEVPEVILRFRDGAFRPACDLMRDPPPSERALARRAAELSAGWVAGDPPPAVWGFAVNLVYSGNASSAWRFLDLAWPGSIPGKDEFLADLRERLRGSPCWSPGPGEQLPAT
jgi:hypothetical protein